ncbi:MAG: hypothetical protein AMJ79_02960, partial [Phycisphaerae bacterium SM23_30]
LINCTIAGNIAGNAVIRRIGYGGGIYNDRRSNPTLKNCILWGNDDSGSGKKEDKQIYGRTAEVTYSCIEDDDPGFGSIPCGGVGSHNVDTNPKFVNHGQEYVYTKADSLHGGEPNYVLIKVNNDQAYQVGEIIEISNDGVCREVKTVKEIDAHTQFVTFMPPVSPKVMRNTIIYKWGPDVTSVIENYHLQDDSPCCDAGDNTAVDDPEDLEGNSRISDNPQVDDAGNGTAPFVDMGVYEWKGLKGGSG